MQPFTLNVASIPRVNDLLGGSYNRRAAKPLSSLIIHPPTFNSHFTSLSATSDLPSPIGLHQCVAGPPGPESALRLPHPAYPPAATAIGHMFLDDRLVGPNSTTASRDQWAKDSWPQVELIWTFLLILHFAALIHIDPLVVHILSLVLKLIPDAVPPLATYHVEAHCLQP
jgi:hypothetical protein